MPQQALGVRTAEPEPPRSNPGAVSAVKGGSTSAEGAAAVPLHAHDASVLPVADLLVVRALQDAQHCLRGGVRLGAQLDLLDEARPRALLQLVPFRRRLFLVRHFRFFQCLGWKKNIYLASDIVYSHREIVVQDKILMLSIKKVDLIFLSPQPAHVPLGPRAPPRTCFFTAPPGAMNPPHGTLKTGRGTGPKNSPA